jgi:imidazolonepropionase-like amidohydrolase
MRKNHLLLLLLFSCISLFAQDYFPENSGVKEKKSVYTAFTNATIYVTPQKKVENGTLLIKDGKIVAVGKSVKLPENTVIIDASNNFIYPSFIETYSNFGIEKPKSSFNRRQAPQYEASRSGYYWNDHIMPENNALEKFKFESKEAEKYRKAGFGVVNTHIPDGIARGTGTLLSLIDEDANNSRVLTDNSGLFFSFKKSALSKQMYPTSLMGAMALLRQFFYDSQWYEKGLSETKDLSIEAYLKNKNKTHFFEAGNKYNDLRADKIGDLFGKNMVLIGGGDEYELIDNIKNTNATFVIPVNFPEAYDVSDPFATKFLTIEEMRDWNQAPSNLKVLSDNQVPFAITTYKLEDPSAIKSKLLKAIDYGFDATKALEALTTIPAQILGVSEKIGTLENGKLANFLISSGPIFDKETVLFENWVQGEKHIINPMVTNDIRGNYTLKLANGEQFTLEISGKPYKPEAKVKRDTIIFPSTFKYEDNWMLLSFKNTETDINYQASALLGKNQSFSGKALISNGDETRFTATYVSPFTANENEKEKAEKETPEILPITYPNIGFGYLEKPKSETLLFKNATVWTSEDQGVLKNTDVLVKNGKIEKIGKNLSLKGAKIIDATGKHLTAGIIDEHSHIAAESINEAGHNSTAEVRISDVLNPEDISIYRSLAGGVTSAQILHGSANPIGGRSAIIKLRWGSDPEGMLNKKAKKFIKFALGENVKQSNWGDNATTRFPQTRMGVEQVYVNYFNRAKAYLKEKESGKTYRYDEELETLAEILQGKRFISCHSYVQSEITMLMRVAEKFGFRVNTFTHILEGYKVADKMKKHGVGASTFADWWAYKYEVNDAIPYNAAILTQMGITTAINSDDDEMQRRLNQEAAKTVKYGGMSEEEAWKMVTINPAKLLHIDDSTGSIKEGKDADLVLWNNNPLSIYAKAEKTIIDGTVYFDIEKDKMLRDHLKRERNKLIQLLAKEKQGGGKTQKPRKKEHRHVTCETLDNL